MNKFNIMKEKYKVFWVITQIQNITQSIMNK